MIQWQLSVAFTVCFWLLHVLPSAFDSAPRPTSRALHVLFCDRLRCLLVHVRFCFVFFRVQIDAKLLKLLAELDKECPPPHTTARLLDKLVISSSSNSTCSSVFYRTELAHGLCLRMWGRVCLPGSRMFGVDHFGASDIGRSRTLRRWIQLLFVLHPITPNTALLLISPLYRQ